MDRKIYEYDGAFINIKKIFLIFFSGAFLIWQRGIIFFSGTELSLSGWTSVRPDDTLLLFIIAAGYFSSIIVIVFLPRFMVVIQRAVFLMAFICSAGLVLPLCPLIVRVFLCVQAFLCVFSIGGMAGEAVCLFSVKTIWYDAIIGMIVSGFFIAFLQNDFFMPDPTVFAVVSIILTGMLLVFHMLIPPVITVPYVSKKNPVKRPSLIFNSLFVLVAFSTFLLLMAASIAETVRHGVSVMYGSAAVFALVMFFIRRKFRENSVKIYGVFFMLSPLGFAFSIISISFPFLSLVSCAFFGFAVALANMWIFFLSLAFSVYPSRYVGASGAAIGFVLSLFHSFVLDFLRPDPQLLYGVYLVVSIVLMILYYFCESYFMTSWNMDGRYRNDFFISGNDVVSDVCGSGGKSGGKSSSGLFAGLSVQELKLARLIVRGFSESDIASEMNISLNTQKSYRKNLYLKLDINSKKELFALAEKLDI